MNTTSTDRHRIDKQGRFCKSTDIHNVVIFGSPAKKTQSFELQKGDAVYLRGRLQARYWEDIKGQKNFSSEVVIDNADNLFVMQSSEPSPLNPLV